jgi:hypothetical protein
MGDTPTGGKLVAAVVPGLSPPSAEVGVDTTKSGRQR